MPPPSDSTLKLYASLTPEERTGLLETVAAEFGLTVEQAKAGFEGTWSVVGRPKQHPPPGEDWTYWFLRCGRGFGKTLSAAQWSKDKGLSHTHRRIALVSPTFADGRDTMVEGETGLLSILSASQLRGGSRGSAWNRGTGELYLANGTKYKVFSSEQPDRLRGPQHHFAWCLVSGTEVLTERGERGIETMMPGDWVETRAGLRRVARVISRYADLVRVTLADGRTLTGSAEHPVATENGWLSLGAIMPGRDRVVTCAGERTTRGISSQASAAEGSTSTGSFGSRLMARFRRACTSITETRIAPTTAWRISSSSTAAPIGASIFGLRSTFAASAVESSLRAQATAESSTAPSTGPKLETLAVASVERLPYQARVYNLTVEGQPEFFANGILTHNCEEVSSWKDAKRGDALETTWSNVKLGLRLGGHPQAVLTSTPKANKLTKELLRLEAPTMVVVSGNSYENRDNLSEAWWNAVVQPYEGTRLGRQEIHAELLEDVEGALWTMAQLDLLRVAEHPILDRIVVGVDPNVDGGEGSDNAGIVVAGKKGQMGYVIADRTVTRGGPAEWAAAAVDAYYEFEADRIVAEKNNGGEMVRMVMKNVYDSVPIKLVHAARGKRTRAEPVAALYETVQPGPDRAGRGAMVRHVGAFSDLEDELTTWDGTGDSPDRMDALVWALWELLVKGRPTRKATTSMPKGRIPGVRPGSNLPW